MTQSNATSLLQAITQAASNPQIDIEKMERLFAMHQKMVAGEAESAFNAAMARAQANIIPVATNAANDFTKSRYATLAIINAAITPIYAAEGLSISFDTADSPVAGCLRIIAHVSHSQGHTRQYHIDLPPDDTGSAGKVNKTKVQATGSTNSYARRYLVMMIFNVATRDDDDGVQGREQTEEHKPKKKAEGLPPYTDADFEADLPRFTKLIASGKKTADQVIATISSKVTPTDRQKKSLQAIKKTEPVAFQAVADKLIAADDLAGLLKIAEQISQVADEKERAELTAIVNDRKEEFAGVAE